MENYYTSSTLLLPLAALSLVSCNSQKKEEVRQPNIIFMMTDDHTPQAMSCYGGNLIQTPNMDRIANEGIRFDNCYAVNALSGPSRACIPLIPHRFAIVSLSIGGDGVNTLRTAGQLYLRPGILDYYGWLTSGSGIGRWKTIMYGHIHGAPLLHW